MVVQVTSVGAMISPFDETPVGQGGEGTHVRQGTKTALGVFNMDDALEVVFVKCVENFEHRLQTLKVVSCQVGDGC